MIEISKDQVWEQVFDRVARTADGLGRRIDLGVMGLVLALNAHGVRTTGSCEGHLDHGHPFPWVWVPSADIGLLNPLLGAFYARGGVPRDRMLTSTPLLEDTYILQPRGAALQERRAPDKRAEVLLGYQQEVRRFAEWLRDRFFEQEVCHAA